MSFVISDKSVFETDNLTVSNKVTYLPATLVSVNDFRTSAVI